MVYYIIYKVKWISLFRFLQILKSGVMTKHSLVSNNQCCDICLMKYGDTLSHEVWCAENANSTLAPSSMRSPFLEWVILNNFGDSVKKRIKRNMEIENHRGLEKEYTNSEIKNAMRKIDDFNVYVIQITYTNPNFQCNLLECDDSKRCLGAMNRVLK